jgi:hypothetical protein
MSKNDQRDIPDAAIEDQNSLEIVRVWVAKKGMHVSLRAGLWDDPAHYGVMLADLAGHIANSFAQSAGYDRGQALPRIKAGLGAEFKSPTDTPTGQIQK